LLICSTSQPGRDSFGRHPAHPSPSGVRCAPCPSSGGLLDCGGESVPVRTVCYAAVLAAGFCSPSAARQNRGPSRALRSALPAYSVLGPFPVRSGPFGGPGRRWYLSTAKLGRSAVSQPLRRHCSGRAAYDLAVLVAALIVNGFTRFVASRPFGGVPHVVPKEQVVAMNSVATRPAGGRVPSAQSSCRAPLACSAPTTTGSGGDPLLIVAIPVRSPCGCLALSTTHCSARRTAAGDPLSVAYAWHRLVHGIRTVAAVPSGPPRWPGRAAHRMVAGINSFAGAV